MSGILIAFPTFAAPRMKARLAVAQAREADCHSAEDVVAFIMHHQADELLNVHQDELARELHVTPDELAQVIRDVTDIARQQGMCLRSGP